MGIEQQKPKIVREGYQPTSDTRGYQPEGDKLPKPEELKPPKGDTAIQRPQGGDGQQQATK